KERPKISQQSYPKTGSACLSKRHKRHSRHTSQLGPIASGSVCYCQERFPYIGVSISDPRRHERCCSDGGPRFLGPSCQLVAYLVAIWGVKSPPVRLNLLTRGAPAHANYHATAKDRIRQVTESCQRDSAIGGQFFCFHNLATHDASTSHSATSVSGVQYSTYFLVVLRRCAK